MGGPGRDVPPFVLRPVAHHVLRGTCGGMETAHNAETNNRNIKRSQWNSSRGIYASVAKKVETNLGKKRV